MKQLYLLAKCLDALDVAAALDTDLGPAPPAPPSLGARGSSVRAHSSRSSDGGDEPRETSRPTLARLLRQVSEDHRHGRITSIQRDEVKSRLLLRGRPGSEDTSGQAGTDPDTAAREARALLAWPSGAMPRGHDASVARATDGLRRLWACAAPHAAHDEPAFIAFVAALQRGWREGPAASAATTAASTAVALPRLADNAVLALERCGDALAEALAPVLGTRGALRRDLSIGPRARCALAMAAQEAGGGFEDLAGGLAAIVELPNETKKAQGPRVHLVMAEDGADAGGLGVVSDLAISAFGLAGIVPEWQTLLVCAPGTHWEDLYTLVLRWAFGAGVRSSEEAYGGHEEMKHGEHEPPGMAVPERRAERRLYCIAAVERLPMPL